MIKSHGQSWLLFHSDETLRRSKRRRRRSQEEEKLTTQKARNTINVLRLTRHENMQYVWEIDGRGLGGLNIHNKKVLIETHNRDTQGREQDCTVTRQGDREIQNEWLRHVLWMSECLMDTKYLAWCCVCVLDESPMLCLCVISKSYLVCAIIWKSSLVCVISRSYY